MNELVGGLGYAVKNWWMSLLLGLLYIAVALCLLFAPVSSYVALSVIFSISILVSGILEIFFAIGNKKIINSWGWYLVFGILAILCSMAIIWQPGLGAVTVLYMLSVTFLIIGCFRIIFSFELKRLHKNK